MRTAGLAVVAAVCFVLCAYASHAAEPSIDEMLEVIGKQLATGGAGAEETPGSGPASRPGQKDEVKPYDPDSEKIRDLKAKISKTTAERRGDYVKFKRYWPEAMLYLDIQKYEMCANILVGRFIAGRAPKRQQGVLGAGDVHREAAQAMVILGRQEQAETYAQEAVNRASRPHMQRMADGAVRFVENYEKNKAEVEAMEAGFAKNPNDAGLRWKLADYYRNKVCRRIDEAIALQDLLDRFPDHAQAKKGEAQWRLAESYDRYQLRDDALKMYLEIDKGFPEYRQVKGGECWWRIGENYRRRKKWKEARTFYQRIMKDAPKHFTNVLRQNQTQTTLASRIQQCNANIK